MPGLAQLADQPAGGDFPNPDTPILAGRHHVPPVGRPGRCLRSPTPCSSNSTMRRPVETSHTFGLPLPEVTRKRLDGSKKVQTPKLGYALKFSFSALLRASQILTVPP